MKVRKVVRKRHHHRGEGTSVVSDVNAVIAANVGETGSSAVRASSKRTARIVRRPGRSRVGSTEEESE